MFLWKDIKCNLFLPLHKIFQLLNRRKVTQKWNLGAAQRNFKVLTRAEGHVRLWAGPHPRNFFEIAYILAAFP